MQCTVSHTAECVETAEEAVYALNVENGMRKPEAEGYAREIAVEWIESDTEARCTCAEA